MNAPVEVAKRTPDGHRLRVLLVAPSLRTIGGQAVQAALLCKYWEEDAEVELRMVPTDPHFPAGLRWAELVPLLRTVVRFPIYLFSLLRQSGWADILHVFSASYWSFLIATVPAMLVARLRGKRLLVNYRSGEAEDHLAHWSTARLLKWADKISVSSEFLAAVFRRFGYQTAIIRNVVDLEDFDAVPRNPFPYRLVCTRNLEPYYGVDIVILAFAEIKTRFPAATLDLIGTGSLKSELEQLVNGLGLSGVRFHGRVDHHEIIRHYREAHVFINGSRLDNFPNAVLEALAAETLIATTDVGGIKHIVENEKTALLSPVDDAKALAANVIRLFQDQPLAASLLNNVHVERQKYSWANLRSEWLELYLSLL